MDLLHALEKPEVAAVLYHKAHQQATSDLTEGNNLADGAAKAAALQPLQDQAKIQGEMLLTITKEDLKRQRETLPTEETEKWKSFRSKTSKWNLDIRRKPFSPQDYVDSFSERTPPSDTQRSIFSRKSGLSLMDGTWIDPSNMTSHKRMFEMCRI